MRHLSTNLLTRWLPVTLLLTVVSCQKTNDTAPASTCKLSRQVYSQTDSQGTYTSEAQYNFDAAGRIISQSSQSVTTPKTGSKSTSTSMSTYVYDANGFLTGQNNTYESTTGGKASVQSNSTTYDYTDGRLVKTTRRDIGTTGTAETSLTKYEYDAGGKVARITNDFRGTTYTQTFTNGLLTKLLVRDVNGVETQPATINSQGLITKYVRDPTSYDISEYDVQQRVVRKETWYQSKLYYYRLTEYDDKKTAFESILPTFKGHPVVVTEGKYINNSTRYTTYGQDNTGAIKKQNDAVYTYTYNAQGYPVDYTFSDAVTGLTGKSTFTLTDCN